MLARIILRVRIKKLNRQKLVRSPALLRSCSSSYSQNAKNNDPQTFVTSCVPTALQLLPGNSNEIELKTIAHFEFGHHSHYLAKPV